MYVELFIYMHISSLQTSYIYFIYGAGSQQFTLSDGPITLKRVIITFASKRYQNIQAEAPFALSKQKGNEEVRTNAGLTGERMSQ